jgi:hypothetical protein
MRATSAVAVIQAPKRRTKYLPGWRRSCRTPRSELQLGFVVVEVAHAIGMDENIRGATAESASPDYAPQAGGRGSSL